MIVEQSKKRMIKSFEDTKYRYESIPETTISGSFGIYIHVPFCYTKCAFCPFYKEVYDEENKQMYIQAIIKEIEIRTLKGDASWLYIGGGTPNTLNIKELNQIVEKIREKITVSSMGIELLPSILTTEYINGLKKIGFSKISIGVESLSEKTLSKHGRTEVKKEKIKELIDIAKESGLWVNVDLMIGLPEQKTSSFVDDVQQISKMNPEQITIYPFMQLGRLKLKSSLTEEEQFEFIEKAWTILQEEGYERKSIWVFAKGDKIYDSSRDELIEDYIGFGPAAFSTYGSWKIVNPELDIYLKNLKNNELKGLIANKEKSSDNWRKFSRMLYDLKGKTEDNLPFAIHLILAMLKIAGYIKNDNLTKKGIMFTHGITKTVVENLPYPLQNTHYIENYEEYEAQKEN